MPTNNFNRGAINEDVTWASAGWSPGQDIQRGQVDAYRDLWNNQQPWTWGNNTVQPWNQNQQAGYDQMGAAAGGNWNTQAIQDFYNKTMSPGGGVDPRYQAQQRAGMSWGDPSMAGMRGLAQSGMGQQGLDAARMWASGGMMGQNPWLRSTFNNAAGDVTQQYQEAVAPSIEGRAAMAGRGGSNAEMGMAETSRKNLGTTLDRLATDIYGGAYEADASRMYGAGMQLPGLINADFARQLAGQQAYGNAAARQQDMRLDAGRTAYGMGQDQWNRQATTAANLPGYVGAAMAPGRAQFDTGQLAQSQAERVAQEQQARHQWEQRQPLDQWAGYTGAYGSEFGAQGRSAGGPGGYGNIAAASERPDDGGFSWGQAGQAALGAGLTLGGAYLGGPGGAQLGSAIGSMFGPTATPTPYTNAATSAPMMGGGTYGGAGGRVPAMGGSPGGGGYRPSAQERWGSTWGASQPGLGYNPGMWRGDMGYYPRY